MLNENQKTIVAAALRGLPMQRLCMIKDRGASFGSFAVLFEPERKIIADRLNYTGRGTDLLVFTQEEMGSSYKIRYLIDESAHGGWTPLNEPASWPLKSDLLVRLKKQLEPHKRNPKGLLSDRTMGIAGLFTALIWWLGFGGSSFLWNIPAGFFLANSVYFLYKYFIGDARKQKKFQLKTLAAIVAEGLTFGAMQDAEQKVVNLKPR